MNRDYQVYTYTSLVAAPPFELIETEASSKLHEAADTSAEVASSSCGAIDCSNRIVVVCESERCNRMRLFLFPSSLPSLEHQTCSKG